MTETKWTIEALDTAISELTQKSEHKTPAIWAADCAEHVLPHFETNYPHDSRVRKAIDAARSWVNGDLAMTDARKVAFAAHAAARDAQVISAAQTAARAAGHAAATAHVATHAIHAANYAIKTIRNTDHADTATAIKYERQWQYEQLLALNTD